MSSENKDGIDIETEPEIKKPIPKKYPFQTAKRNSNNSEKNKPTNIEDSKSEQIDIKMTEKESLPKVSLIQIANEVPTTVETIPPEMVSERHDEKIKDADTEIQEAKTPATQPVEFLATENTTEFEVVEVAEKKEARKKIRRKDLTEKEINEICGDRDGRRGEGYTKTRSPGLDPRFQQQNQTLRCFVMYTDFYRCEKILGEGESACSWFKDVFTSICPLDWIRRWDEAREEGRLGWTRSRTQGKFPGDRYGS